MRIEEPDMVVVDFGSHKLLMERAYLTDSEPLHAFIDYHDEQDTSSKGARP